MKQCTKCKDNKELSEFPRSKRYKSGYNSQCKLCVNAHNKTYRDENIELINQSRREHYQKNAPKMREEKKKYYASHKSYKAKYDIVYRKANSLAIKEYKRAWELLHKDDPIFKIKRNLRRRVHHALEGNCKSDKTFELIGCSPQFFKDYISDLFQKDMSWDNYGEWHIDHIKPCFTFNLSNPEEQRKCFHYSNQRPLWKLDNLRRPRNIEQVSIL